MGLSKKDYVALGEAILKGKVPPKELMKSIGEFANKIQSLLLEVARGDPQATFLALIYPLGMWYLIREAAQEGRCPLDSPEAQAAARMISDVLSLVLPRVAISLATGDATSLSRLASVVEFARNIPDLGDLDQMEQSLRRLENALGLKKRKMQAKTKCLRALLPLWLLGFGRLSMSQRLEVLEQAGLSENEIPEDDNLRQFLSYHHVPALSAYLWSSVSSTISGDKQE